MKQFRRVGGFIQESSFFLNCRSFLIIVDIISCCSGFNFQENVNLYLYSRTRIPISEHALQLSLLLERKPYVELHLAAWQVWPTPTLHERCSEFGSRVRLFAAAIYIQHKKFAKKEFKLDLQGIEPLRKLAIVIQFRGHMTYWTIPSHLHLNLPMLREYYTAFVLEYRWLSGEGQRTH